MVKYKCSKATACKQIKRMQLLSHVNVNNQTVSKSGRSYPRRNIPIFNYKEPKDIPLDRYVYCDSCKIENIDFCKMHAFTHIRDTRVPITRNDKNRAEKTLPKDWLEIRKSSIRNAGKGVFALRKIPKGVKFGPYKGKKESTSQNDEYTWAINNHSRNIKFVNGHDKSRANWMRYVNCARQNIEQNLIGFQYRGNIYYRSIKDITPGTELLVYYGNVYAKVLGIDTSNFYLPIRDSDSDVQFYQCKYCNLKFIHMRKFKKHYVKCVMLYENDEGANNNKNDTDEPPKIDSQTGPSSSMNRTNTSKSKQKSSGKTRNILNSSSRTTLMSNCKLVQSDMKQGRLCKCSICKMRFKKHDMALHLRMHRNEHSTHMRNRKLCKHKALKHTCMICN